MCYIADGRAGACDRYANVGGELVRVDPLTMIENTVSSGGRMVEFLQGGSGEWDGDLVAAGHRFITAVGAGTTYPDYKPAPFIVSQKTGDVDMVTVVTEGIFSYCGAKVKIDTDRFVGPETSAVRVDGEPIGHVTTGEYGSQMLALGGVHHLTGGSKKEGRVTCDALMRLCNREPVEMTVDGGASLVLQAGRPPIIDGVEESRMRSAAAPPRSACSPSSGRTWWTRSWSWTTTSPASSPSIRPASCSTSRPPASASRAAARPPAATSAWPSPAPVGAAPTSPIRSRSSATSTPPWPSGLRLLMLSTTGEQYGYYVLDEALRPVLQPICPPPSAPPSRRSRRIASRRPVSVLFVGGAGGSLRAGVTTNPVRLTRSVRAALTHVSCGGAPAYVWPGGGITVMVDVMEMPSGSFGYVPTPAIVAPIEFTMRLDDYRALGGHMDAVVPIEVAVAQAERRIAPVIERAWPTDRRNFAWGG